jgi:type I restriction enzyme S subunit
MELTKTKFKQTEVGLIPEDWNIDSLGSICYFENGDRGFNYPSKSDFRSWGKLFVNAGHIRNNEVSLVDMDFINDEKYEKLNGGKFIKGDILFCLRGSLGKFAVLKDEVQGAIASSLIIIRPNVRKTTVDFLKFYFQSITCKRMIDLLAGGAAQPNLGGRELSLFKIPLPSTLTEQKAIAKALSDVDELIAKLEKLIEKKKAIKQGAMQALLTPPHKGGKRLEGFSGEWETNVFSKVCDLIHGHQFLTEDFVNSGIGIKVIKIGNVNFNKLILDNCDCVDSTKFSSYEKYQIKQGDVLMSLTGNIGRVVKVGVLKEKLLQNYRVGRFVPKGLDNDFLSIVLGAPKTTKQLEQLSNQAAQANFGKQDFNKVYLDYPIDIDEQKAIAKIIISINEEIESLEIKLSKSRCMKQGMMQELLTGKTRLV